MKTLDAELLNALTGTSDTPCLSIYLPVHSSVAASNLDTLGLKNMIKDIRAHAAEHDTETITKLLAPVENYLDSKEFVRETNGTLAIFSSAKLFETVILPEDISSAFYIDDCFYLLPLLDFASNNNTFQILALGKNHVRLFEGNRYGLEEIELHSSIPTTMKEALGYDLTDNHLHASAGGSAAIHGYMEITDERDTDNTRFFRIIDQEINERYSKKQKLPLLLAALPENHSLFQSISKNECLQQHFISLNADRVDKAQMHSRALELLDQEKSEAIAKQLARYASAKAEQLATDDVADIARHAMDSRIERLFLSEGLTMAGTVSVTERKIRPNEDSTGDIINRIALLTYKQGGHIHTLRQNNGKLPAGIGSINRF